jgi:NADPH-dependent glutamate synthase beta subunit-like oxidoreductase
VVQQSLPDYLKKQALPENIPVTKNEKVAVVGAGPTGLTAAYFLAKKGYAVTVFEAASVAGGMLALGVPEHRLPRKVLDWEINALKKSVEEQNAGQLAQIEVGYEEKGIGHLKNSGRKLSG